MFNQTACNTLSFFVSILSATTTTRTHESQEQETIKTTKTIRLQGAEKNKQDLWWSSTIGIITS